MVCLCVARWMLEFPSWNYQSEWVPVHLLEKTWTHIEWQVQTSHAPTATDLIWGYLRHKLRTVKSVVPVMCWTVSLRISYWKCFTLKLCKIYKKFSALLHCLLRSCESPRAALSQASLLLDCLLLHNALQVLYTIQYLTLHKHTMTPDRLTTISSIVI